MKVCYICKTNKCEEILDIYCLDCRWDIHHSRRWDNRDLSKEEWKLLYRRLNNS
jgi:hypothetical protein